MPPGGPLHRPLNRLFFSLLFLRALFLSSVQRAGTGTTTATMTPPTSMIHICDIDVRVRYREEALVLVVVERVGGKVCADIGEEEDLYLCLDQDEDEDL